jgi:hypothetical protein
MVKQLTWTGIFLRFIFATLIVFLSYNPEGYSYFHWGIKGFLPLDPLKVLAGIVLVIGWVIYIRATRRSLGTVGLVLAGGLCAAVLWLLIDIGWSKNSFRFYAYTGLVITTIILTAGMCWSHIRRRMSGQTDTDDVSDND